MNHVMLDLETLGTRPGSVILSIGAIAFHYTDHLNGSASEFYVEIDLEDSLQCGMSVDASTIKWWMAQGDIARSVITNTIDKKTLKQALGLFTAWLPKDFLLWGNGSDFDNAILAEAYMRQGFNDLPWKFSKNRCYRTLKSLYPEIKIDRCGTHHNALDDARSQAWHLIEILKTRSRI